MTSTRPLIVQHESDTGGRFTKESRAVRTAAMLVNGFEVVTCTLAQLLQHRAILQSGAMPVGSVEFVRAAMRLAGIEEPANMSYPASDAARKHLRRQIRRSTAAEALGLRDGPFFVKPETTKAFTGFVLDLRDCAKPLDEHDSAQLQALRAMDPASPVWVSEAVHWQCEWRCYVQDRAVIGMGRYDEDGADDAPEPDIESVHQLIMDLGIDHPFVVDVGVLENSQTALVEINDAWAIGLYDNALSPKNYLEFLVARWDSLLMK